MRASRARSPARSRGAATSSFSASSTGSPRESRAKCSRLGPGLVIDLAADFRVRSTALYERYYGEHTAPDLLPRFCYGLADVVGEALRGAGAIAAPGCFATAAQLALYPLARARVDVAPVAVRRHRLQRRRRTAQAHDAPSDAGAQPLRLLGAGAPARGRSPAVVAGVDGPTRRDRPTHDSLGSVRPGHLSHAARQAARRMRAIDGTTAAAWYREAYAGRPFVRLLDAPPELTHAVGTNYALIHAAASEDGSRASGDGRDGQPGEGSRRAGHPGDEPGPGYP